MGVLYFLILSLRTTIMVYPVKSPWQKNFKNNRNKPAYFVAYFDGYPFSFQRKD